MGVAINCFVEGLVDELAVRALFEKTVASNATISVYPQHGKAKALRKLPKLNESACSAVRFFVLVDLDRDECAPLLLKEHLPVPSPFLSFRIAVRAVESWLLADRERMANFLGISVKRIPKRPDELDDPKTELVNLARKSRRKSIRRMAPRRGSGRPVGEDYTLNITEFIKKYWKPQEARRNSDSLDRAIRSIENLARE